MRYSTRAALAGALLLAACGDVRPPTSPLATRPSTVISDGASGKSDANKNFFFLPPLVPNPSTHADFDAGRFNPTWKPVVEICVDDATNPGVFPVNALGDCITRHHVFAAANVVVYPADELYQVNWKTDALGNQSGIALDVARLYRIRVRIGSTEIGFADVDPITRDELKNAQTGETVPLLEGRTLPIKFRIEAGVLAPTGYAAPDYVIRKVPASGGTVKTANDWAGAYFPDGWLNGILINGQPITEAYVAIERVYVGPDNKCHAGTYALAEFEGCYKYNTFPDFGAQPFGKAAIVRNCPEIAEDDPRYAALRHYKSDVGEPVAVLKEAKAPFTLTCPIPNSQVAITSTALLDRIEAGVRHLAAGFGMLLGPRPLYAVDLGAGGETNFFSNIGLGIERNLSLSGTYSTSATAGTVIPVSAMVWGAHTHVDAITKAVSTETVPLPGEIVSFSVTKGSLGAGGATAVNGAAGSGGVAMVDWTISEGENTLTASVVGFDGAPRLVTLTITGTPVSAPAFDVTGLVKDGVSGQPLFQAVVRLDITQHGALSNSTSTDGVYRIQYSGAGSTPLLPAGATGTITASIAGYRSVSKPFVVPADGALQTVNFDLFTTSQLFYATFDNDALSKPPAAPEVGTWRTSIPGQSTILVKEGLSIRYVELNQPEGLTATGGFQAPDLIGSIAGTAPTSGTYIARWIASVGSNTVGFAYVTLGSGIGAVEYRPNGVISYSTASGQTPLQVATWTSGQPQLFELYVDVSNKKASLSIDGTRVQLVQNVDFTASTGSLGGIAFNMGGTTAQILNYDKVSIAPAPAFVQ